MKINILEEWGWQYALYGLSRSYSQSLKKMPKVAAKLAFGKDRSEWKFLRMVQVAMRIIAPRYWWQQFDTYRIGVEKQSASTMHTLGKRELMQEDFARPIPSYRLEELNLLIRYKKFDELKNELPEGFMQERVVMANYQSLYNIYVQRENHKLDEWKKFCDEIESRLEFFYMFLCNYDEDCPGYMQDFKFFYEYLERLPNYRKLGEWSEMEEKK